MTNPIFFALGLGLIFGVLFFIVDIYNEQKTKERFDYPLFHPSFKSY